MFVCLYCVNMEISAKYNAKHKPTQHSNMYRRLQMEFMVHITEMKLSKQRCGDGMTR